MKYTRILALVLTLALLLSCVGFSPVQAAQSEQAESTSPSETQAPQLSDEQPSQKNHTERLYADEGNDLSKRVYRNHDGSKTMYIYDHPVKYRDEQGQTHDISLDIADTGDSAYPFRTQANSAVTAFPASLPDGITLSGNGVNLRLAAQLP